MQNESLFATMIEAAIRTLKTSKPGAIAAEILPKLFPKTFATANEEGADTYLLDGFTSAVRGHIKSIPHTTEEAQESFFKRFPKLFPFIQELSHGTYYTPSVDQFVSIFDLCEKPELLDSARKFMRQKSEEVGKEADRLDDLYNAVIRARRHAGFRKEAAASVHAAPPAE